VPVISFGIESQKVRHQVRVGTTTTRNKQEIFAMSHSMILPSVYLLVDVCSHQIPTIQASVEFIKFRRAEFDRVRKVDMRSLP